MHCHIGWHLAKGKVGYDVIFPTSLVTNCSVQLAVVVVQPREIEQIRWPQPWLDVSPTSSHAKDKFTYYSIQLCNGTDPNAFGPARRSFP